jgi:hypothetical protein
VSLLVLLPQAGAATGNARSVYSAGAVTKAFRSAGLPLFDPEFGQPIPVRTLVSVKAHDGWKLGVYVYSSPKGAEASYRATGKAWEASGIAALRLKNLVVTAAPAGRSLAKKAKHFPMPSEVLKALGKLAGA